MCGRFCFTISPEILAGLFSLPAPVPEFPPRYNIPPHTAVCVIRETAGVRHADRLLWGLIPSWNRDPAAHGFINARAESLLEKPSFRDPFRRQRCIIPASGFFEWQHLHEVRQPWYIRRRDKAPLLMAGLWDRWRRSDGTELESCAIITTGANDRLRPIHDRMPVVLERDDIATWLSPKTHEATLMSFLIAPPDAELETHRVATLVNSPHNDSPECILPRIS